MFIYLYGSENYLCSHEDIYKRQTITQRLFKITSNSKSHQNLNPFQCLFLLSILKFKSFFPKQPQTVRYSKILISLLFTSLHIFICVLGSKEFFPKVCLKRRLHFLDQICTMQNKFLRGIPVLAVEDITHTRLFLLLSPVHKKHSSSSESALSRDCLWLEVSKE